MTNTTFTGKLVDLPLFRILPFTYEPAATFQLMNVLGEIMDILLTGEQTEMFLLEVNTEAIYTVHGTLGHGYDETLMIVDNTKVLLTAANITVNA